MSLAADLDRTRQGLAGACDMPATYARDTLRRSRATADVAAAYVLDEELPQLGAALVAGEVSREHVDTAVRTLKRIPVKLRE
jgi:hypothetical protein